MKKFLVRLQNKKVLTAIVSGILAILVNTGTVDLDVAKGWEVTANSVLIILVTLGIVSNPDSHVKE